MPFLFPDNVDPFHTVCGQLPVFAAGAAFGRWLADPQQAGRKPLAASAGLLAAAVLCGAASLPDYYTYSLAALGLFWPAFLLGQLLRGRAAALAHRAARLCYGVFLVHHVGITLVFGAPAESPARQPRGLGRRAGRLPGRGLFGRLGGAGHRGVPAAAAQPGKAPARPRQIAPAPWAAQSPLIHLIRQKRRPERFRAAAFLELGDPVKNLPPPGTAHRMPHCRAGRAALRLLPGKAQGAGVLGPGCPADSQMMVGARPRAFKSAIRGWWGGPYSVSAKVRWHFSPPAV